MRLWKWIKQYVYRSAVTGKFVSKKEYMKNVRETFRDTIKRKIRRPR